MCQKTPGKNVENVALGAAVPADDPSLRLCHNVVFIVKSKAPLSATMSGNIAVMETRLGRVSVDSVQLLTVVIVRSFGVTEACPV